MISQRSDRRQNDHDGIDRTQDLEIVVRQNSA